MAITAPDNVETDVERRASLMIKISNLSKSFSGQTVLDHLNLDIQKGEVVALIGSSGREINFSS